MWADARIWRSENRYTHRCGATRFAEKHETLTLNWYSPEEIAIVVTEAGFRDVSTGESPRDGGEDRTFALSART